MWTKTFLPTTFFLLALVLGGSYSDNVNAGWVYPTCTAAKSGGTCEGTQAVVESCLDAVYGYLGPRSYETPSTGQTPWSSPVIYNGNFGATTIYCSGVPEDDTPNPCEARQGTSAIPSGKVAYGENAIGTSPSTARMCDADLCVIKINQATTIPIGGGLQANYITNGTFTGEQATGPSNCPITVTANTPKDPSLPKPIDTVTPAADTPDGVPLLPTDCPPGSAFGTVNGVNVCSPSGSEIAYQPSTTTQNNNGTTTESTTQKSDTVNDDGSVTTTTTTTATSNGASSTTTTSSTNGRDGLDGKDGKGIDSIDLGVAPAAESGDVPAIPGIAPGTGQDGAGQAERTFTVGTHFSGSGSCIADRSVTVLGVTVTVPLSELCPWFDIMYKVVSIMATFAALRILVMA